MTDEYLDEEVDIEPYEGSPDFQSSGVLNDEGQQDDDSDPEDPADEDEVE